VKCDNISSVQVQLRLTRPLHQRWPALSHALLYHDEQQLTWVRPKQFLFPSSQEFSFQQTTATLLLLPTQHLLLRYATTSPHKSSNMHAKTIRTSALALLAAYQAQAAPTTIITPRVYQLGDTCVFLTSEPGWKGICRWVCYPKHYCSRSSPPPP